MKTIARLLLLALLAAFAPLASAGTFASEKLVSTDPSMGSQFPEVAYYNGVIHVVWVGYVSGKLGDIYYARSAVATGTFSTPVNLSNNATASFGNDRPQVTAGPNGVFVGWNSSNDTGAIYVRRSLNDGADFVNGTAAAAVLVAGVEGDAYYSRITHLFTDSAGHVHLAYYTNADTAGASGMVHHRLTCDGATWNTDTAVTAKALDGDVDNEEPRLAESGGRLYVTYRSSMYGNPQGGWPPYAILMKSMALGTCTGPTTWTYPARRIGGGVPLSYASTYRPTAFGDSGGNLHLAWWDTTSGANVMYRNGNPASAAFGAPANLSGFTVDHLEPGGLTSTASTAAGGFQAPPGLVSNGSKAIIAFQSNTAVGAGGFENGAIYLRESDDNGATWGTAQTISTTNQGTTPRLAIDNSNNQNIAVVWSDDRTGSAAVYYRLYTVGPVSGPLLTLSPSPSDFGSQAVGTATAPIAFTLSNGGTALGNISSITTSGIDYAISSTTCGTTLGVGASCTVNVTFTPQALGARTGSIVVASDAFDTPTTASLTGTGLASASFNANVSAVVTGYYETILGREPDSGGLTFWIGEANRVVALGADVREVFYAMSIQFFNSTEYLSRNTSDTQYLTDLYRTFFIREPDAAGLAYWQSQLSGGMDRGAMLNNFLFSTEFSNQMTTLFGTPSIRPEVNMTMDLYRGILGVLPDDSGFNYWLGQIRTAQCQGSSAVVSKVNQISQAFITSPQYAARDASRPAALRNYYYIGDLYNAFLRRGGDLSGYLYWVGQVNTGAQTRDRVRQQFLTSPEFQARVNAVIAAGCL